MATRRNPDLASVLRHDEAVLHQARLAHTTGHRCEGGHCAARQVYDEALAKILSLRVGGARPSTLGTPRSRGVPNRNEQAQMRAALDKILGKRETPGQAGS